MRSGFIRLALLTRHLNFVTRNDAKPSHRLAPNLKMWLAILLLGNTCWASLKAGWSDHGFSVGLGGAVWEYRHSTPLANQDMDR